VKLSVLKRNQPIQKIDLGKEVLAFDYSETVFLIGRSKDCHIVLDDKQVSREHVRIIHKNGKWFAEKTAEHNACLFNGEDFNRTELDDGDSLIIGNFTINIENSSESTVEFSAASSPTPIINPDVEAPPAATRNIATETVVASKAIPVQNRDLDATREIDTADLTNEIQNPLADTVHQESSTRDATSEIEVPSDFESFDQPVSNADDEFSYDENTENEAEIALGLNAEAPADGNNSMMESDENMSYSLENIDSGSD
jgi:predicted component of type VI protein secretion system